LYQDYFDPEPVDLKKERRNQFNKMNDDEKEKEL